MLAITLIDLARELDTDPRRLFPVVDAGYLKVIQELQPREHTVVRKPPQKAIDWLRGMFAPIWLKPMLPLRDAAELLSATPAELRQVAIEYSIPLHMDLAFGELISVTNFHRLHRSLVRTRRPLRYDRQALLGVIALMRGIPTPLKDKAFKFKYSDRLEMEIVRIGKLQEPQRTSMALAFYTAYHDAKTVADCLERFYGATHPAPGGEARLAERIENLARRYGGVSATVVGDESSAPGPASSAP